MSGVHGVALYLPDDQDAHLVEAIENGPRTLSVVRRCADIAELEAAGMSGVADLAAISTQDPDIDAPFIERLHSYGMKVVLLRSNTNVHDHLPAHYYYSLGADRVADTTDAPALVQALHQLALNEPYQPETPENKDPNEPATGSLDKEFHQIIANGNRDIPVNPPSAAEPPDDPQAGDTQPLIAVNEVPQEPASAETQTPSFPSRRSLQNNTAHAPRRRISFKRHVAAEETQTASDQPLGVVLAIYGTSGAPGRTTTALNVATELVAHASVCVIDADLSAPSVAHSWGLIVEGSSMSALARLRSRGTLLPVHLEETAYDGPKGVQVLTGITSPHRWREISPSTIHAIIDVCRHLWDYTIVDLHAVSYDPSDEYSRHVPHRDHIVEEVLSLADGVVVVARADAVGLHRFLDAWEWLDSQECAAQRFIVANMGQSERCGGDPRRAVAQALSATVPGEEITVVPFDTRVLTALLKGKPLTGSVLRSARGAFRYLSERIRTANLSTRS